MERRGLVGGGLLAGLTALAAAGTANAAEAAQRDDERVADAVNRLRDTVAGQFETTTASALRALRSVRRVQRDWVRSTQKYPDFVEVGVDVWDGLYDWHVLNQQPISMTRRADGKYVIAFMFTTVILRPDQAPDYVGYPFDQDPVRRP